MKHTNKTSLLGVVFGALLLTGSASVLAQESTDQKPAPAADNTKVNQRDKNSNEPTADQQKDNRSDREITRQIRQSIMKDKTLSTDAHNVKIISQNGMVTLRGPVRTEEEKKAIEDKAVQVAGASKVTNELDVKPKS